MQLDTAAGLLARLGHRACLLEYSVIWVQAEALLEGMSCTCGKGGCMQVPASTMQLEQL